MISVFFRCACPYVGYTLKRADYVKGEMLDCTPVQMTRTGHKLLHSSGSYLVLGRFEGKKYFHIRQSKSTALDEQGRQIYTNLALVGVTAEDERVINRIAGYALLDEDRFYQEIASMMILLDGDFSVDLDALKAFLDRFSRDYRVETSNLRLKEVCREILFAETHNEIDFIVAEADWNYFVKQVGISFRVPPYCFTYSEAKAMAESAKLTFPEAGASVDVPEEPQKPVAPVQKEPAEKPDFSHLNQELALLRQQMDDLRQAGDRKAQEKLATEAEKGILHAQQSKAEEKMSTLAVELQQLMEKIKKNFFLGILVGMIGTALAVLIFGQIGGCAKDKPVEAEQPTASVTTEVMDTERRYHYAG